LTETVREATAKPAKKNTENNSIENPTLTAD
jgi:hypothetical protein